MKVVIVAKTRMGSGACVGAVSFEGQSLRLLAPGQETREGQFNLEYNVGDVWDITYDVPDELVPPHVESVVVKDKRKLPPLDDLCQFIVDRMPPAEGGAEVLFQGLTQVAPSGIQFISSRTGVPEFSTMFWRTDRPLVRVVDQSVRIRYRYPGDEGGRMLTFVGFQEPVEEIPAGTMVRVSLAHWWRPDNKPDEELRCYVQLSGWIENSGIGPVPVTSQSGSNEQAIAADSNWDMEDAEEQLRRVFGFDSFRTAQHRIIGNLAAKQNTLAIMPTGSGKSLCYQLPAILFPGLTVVVSPLIALMEDQVMQLQELGIRAAFLNSSLHYDEQLHIMQRVRAKGIDLLYAAPETLMRPEILRLLEDVSVDCLAIDEAHCISEWGHDFRPEYRQLGDVRRRLPKAVCLALTATATQRVRQDIRDSLGLADADEVVTSFNRENLFLSAIDRHQGWAQLTSFLRAHKGQSGLIYCLTRVEVDRITADLQGMGLPAIPYHAGLDNDTRRLHHRRFTYEEDAIVVATIAFGMGINKSNVRFVIHYGMPKEIESYYQQIGRAGRDGLPADCLLLYSPQDMMTANFHIGNLPPQLRAPATVRLRQMSDFAETKQCRRRPLLNYFDETYEDVNCGMCDNCVAAPEELVDLTVPAQKFLSCVRRTGEMYGASYIIDVLRGSRNQRILSQGHDELTTYAIGREYSAKQWNSLARQLVEQSLLHRDPNHGGLSVTDAGHRVLRGNPFMGVAAKIERSPTGTPESTQDLDSELFELLRARRAILAEERKVPPYVILNDRTLLEMASVYPQTSEELMQIHGIGEVKVARFGAAFLEIIREYCQALGKVSLVNTLNRRPSKEPDDTRSLVRLERISAAFQRGESIDQIAAAISLNRRTVVGYLEKALRRGHRFPIDQLRMESGLPEEDLIRALLAYAEIGADLLRPIYEQLGEAIGYDDLQIARLIFLNEVQADEPAQTSTR